MAPGNRALVTGGTGFIGRNLVQRLLDDGTAVHLVVRPAARRWRLDDLDRRVEIHTADLQDGDAVRRVVHRVRPEWIFHLAVHGAYSFETDLRAMILTNVLGTANLLAASLETGCAAFVNTGSSSEYGLKDHPPTEDEVLEPNSDYAVTKASATWLCRHTARRHGVHVPTLRLYSAFGPYEDGRRLIPALVAHALRGRLPPLASPATARDYVYVDDVVEAYLLAASVPGQETGAVYNVGSGVQTSLADLVAVARRLFGVAAAPVWESYGARDWDTSVWVAAPQRIRAALGWKPEYDLERGLRSMAAWLQAHRHLYPELFPA